MPTWFDDPPRPTFSRGGRRAGGRVPPVRVQACGGSRLGGFVRNLARCVQIEVEGEPPTWTGSWPSWPSGPRPWPGSSLSWAETADAGDRHVPHRDERTRRREPDLHLPRRRHLPRLPRGVARSRRPAVRLPVPELHQLRPAADDHHRRPLRPPADHDGRLRDVRRLPGRVRGSAATAASTPQPTACPACGPRLGWCSTGPAAGCPSPIRSPPAEALLAGEIGAVEGPRRLSPGLRRAGDVAVAGAARRKHRDEKPFAVMVPDAAAVAGTRGTLGDGDVRPADSPGAPIVLLRRRRPPAVAEGVAPGNPWLGVMLPYTPLHHLLLRAVGGRPLVMTSGNRSDEPIAYRDDDAVERLAGIADLFLTSRPPDPRPRDDSVTRVVAGERCRAARAGSRRGRSPCRSPARGRPSRSGGQLKGTFALGRGPACLSSAITSATSITSRRYRAFGGDRRPVRGALRRQARGGSSTTCTPTTLDRLRPAAARRPTSSSRPAPPCAHGELHGRAWPRRAGHRRHVRRHGLRDRRGRLGRRVPRRRSTAVPPRRPISARRHARGRPGRPRAVADGVAWLLAGAPTPAPRSRWRNLSPRTAGTRSNG